MLFTSLDQWLSHLETAHPVGIDMGLARITRVKESLGLKFACPVITVGGTNGKGSTCAFLESILLAAGYKVACHTSPHLLRFNERARMNGADVSDADLLKAFERVEQARCRLSDPPTLTYFEFTTLAIMDIFANASVDAVILEVGMGGRLDAVNIVDADCAIVTSIDLDHMAYLGNTREAIAFEKAGIFRTKAIAICADPMPPTSLINHANAIGADLWLMGKDYSFTGDQQQWGWTGRGKRFSGLGYPALRGANQLLNASAVIAALIALHDRLPVSAQDIRNGLALVELPGRFQVLPGRPTVVLDVAHNPHAAATLAESIEAMAYHPYTYAVFGAMADKDIDGVLKPLLNTVDYWYCTDLPTPRAASASDLAKRLRAFNKEALVFMDPGAAYQAALDKAGEGDRILVFGSFYTVSGVMAYRNNQAH
ncbi:MAG: bifunctional tetrahydrofolate synthase/dihydrofolate synthase [Burkholderiaceae bacterium]|nr:bifunctional tetrahydrofolate synthase/dihydrofolate synthase [Burkholderiaceae bacterium]NCA09584.1 bifunctional tetrahydrofolate synthase/dihydrofolate synthase [Burkholderiaceae bacterium]NCX41214.1 bifunctional tetrahydrofolate synthase/dihydrofolate synthase [Burkholderiaceae bacterium]NDC50924.1 bifunctional tetrahydrofolate synthase/dihydrofolate synthase [Burkholderiaceae bacterium]